MTRYIGNPNSLKRGIYFWIGGYNWGGIGFKGRYLTMNVHLKELLGCFGASPRIKFLWFCRAWKVLLVEGFKTIRRR